MVEIERKFLIINTNFKKESEKSYIIKQGYLNRDPSRTVRIRIKNNEGYITVKGKSFDGGVSRFEWEKQIDIDEAESLIKLCDSGVIHKERFIVEKGNHTFEVDEFLGENTGLCIAEVELSNPNEDFVKPDWLGKEVTGDERFYNSYISRNPYSKW